MPLLEIDTSRPDDPRDALIGVSRPLKKGRPVLTPLVVSPEPKDMPPLREITGEELKELITEAEASEELLIIDMRSFFIYDRNHIKNAINVSLPRALTAKKNVTLDRVEVLITNEEAKNLFRERKQRTVVVYDDTTDSKAERPASNLIRLLIENDQCSNVRLLQGGFSNFARACPELCTRPDCDSDDDLDQYPFDETDDEFGSSRNSLNGMDDATEIEAGLVFLGSERNAANAKALEMMGIACLLNMATECSNHFPELFEYKNINIYDDPDVDVSLVLDEAADFIGAATKAGRPVLVHCYMGISRSATAVIVYLMKYRGMTLQEAYTFVKSLRPKVCPNSGFMGALIKYEKKLYGSISLNSEEYAPFLMMAQWDEEEEARQAAASAASTASASGATPAASDPDPAPTPTAASMAAAAPLPAPVKLGAPKATPAPTPRHRPMMSLMTDITDEAPPMTPRAASMKGRCAFSFGDSPPATPPMSSPVAAKLAAAPAAPGFTSSSPPSTPAHAPTDDGMTLSVSLPSSHSGAPSPPPRNVSPPPRTTASPPPSIPARPASSSSTAPVQRPSLTALSSSGSAIPVPPRAKPVPAPVSTAPGSAKSSGSPRDKAAPLRSTRAADAQPAFMDSDSEEEEDAGADSGDSPDHGPGFGSDSDDDPRTNPLARTANAILTRPAPPAVPGRDGTMDKSAGRLDASTGSVRRSFQASLRLDSFASLRPQTPRVWSDDCTSKPFVPPLSATFNGRTLSAALGSAPPLPPRERKSAEGASASWAEAPPLSLPPRPSLTVQQ